MIPDGWTLTQLQTVLDGPIKNGYSPVAATSETGYWVLSLGALGDNGLAADQIKPVKPELAVLKNLLSEGDFLVSRSNTPDKVGRSAKFRGELKNCSYPDLMMRFRVDNACADENFIAHKLKSHQVRSYYRSHAAGSSSTMVKINKPIVEKTPILLPPLREQTKIADILSTWDQAIETTEKLIENSKAQKKALMQQLLTGKKRLPGFSDEWQETAFERIFSAKKLKNSTNEAIEVLSVTKGGIVFQRDHFKKDVASDDKSDYLIAERGDLVMSGLNFWMGSIDYQYLCDRGLVSPAYKVFDTDDTITDPRFMRFVVRSSQMQKLLMRSSIQGASIVRRNLDTAGLYSSMLLLPSRREQEVIAQVLQAAEKDTENFETQLQLLCQQKKALMQQLLTGKRRVKVAA